MGRAENQYQRHPQKDQTGVEEKGIGGLTPMRLLEQQRHYSTQKQETARKRNSIVLKTNSLPFSLSPV
jgi:hypothetical protein